MAVAASVGNDLLSTIREENLQVYRVAPPRLGEDVRQEGEVAQNYRGRLTFELLQNADDAMNEDDGGIACIRFVLTDDDLWVSNSGRRLDEADIRGLCGLGASSKAVAGGPKRATIGHKGMGFKSVLEITDSPEVYSTTIALRFGPAESRRAVQALVHEGVFASASRAPICRFPWTIETKPHGWQEMVARGMRTAFRFPLRTQLTKEHRDRLADTLIQMPLTALLFLKHLRRVELVVHRAGDSREIAWTIDRGPVGEIVRPVVLRPDRGVAQEFLLAHAPDLKMGAHRGGLDEVSWEGVELTEVSVAVRLRGGRPTDLEPEWRRLHVFLPSEEPCPYQILVSGAFNASLSRQEIRVERGPQDYNRFLLTAAAILLRDRLMPALRERGATLDDLTRLLDRGVPPGQEEVRSAGHTLVDATRRALRSARFIPSESDDDLSPDECVVPPLVTNPEVGRQFREVLDAGASWDGRTFPAASACAGNVARVIVDLGARHLNLAEATVALSTLTETRARAIEDDTERFVWVDPILTVLQRLWEALSPDGRTELERLVRLQPLFPVHIEHRGSAQGQVRRVVVGDAAVFYPPQSLTGEEIPLPGLRFLAPDICWGALTRKERLITLRREMIAWQALFGVREFRFADVMHASVIPALELERGTVPNVARATFHDIDHLAAICQLAGRTAKRESPLPYERLGSDRTFINLSRLDVPCRRRGATEVAWRPAYQVYFGESWVGDRSVERLAAAGPEAARILADAWFLVPPSEFRGALARYGRLGGAVAPADDEVSSDEDDEAALDPDEPTRWFAFFSWLGVHSALRPVHFHDVEDGSGWLRTENLARPDGAAFARLAAPQWSQFVQEVRGELGARLVGVVPYFYRLHDLEHLAALLEAAAGDRSGQIGQALYLHLVRNWGDLEHFARLQVALVPTGLAPALRSRPPKPKESELVEAGPDFWVRRLRRASFCPTRHGSRLPNSTWLETAEVRRRFGFRRGGRSFFVLPVLNVPGLPDSPRARAFAREIGLREELTPADFSPADARLVLDELRDIYAGRTDRGEDLADDLSTVIRPTYRAVIELLGSRERVDRPVGGTSAVAVPLADAPLLVRDGSGVLRFVRARDAFYSDRRETRDRLRDNAQLATFILEAWPAARATLPAMFGVRVLEDALTWMAREGSPALVDDDLQRFRTELERLAPYVLARVGVDRQEEDRMRSDARRLRAFVAILEPVRDLVLNCQLDGRQLAVAEQRLEFVERDAGPISRAYVVWSGPPWPPGENAEALVVALCEVIEGAYYEPFLALAQAPNDEARERLLRRVGVTRDEVGEMRRLLALADELVPTGKDQPGPTDIETNTPILEPSEPSTPESGAETGTGGDTEGTAPAVRAPLYRWDQLLINGEPVMEHGNALSRGPSGSLPESGTSAAGPRHGGNPDRGPIDRLGMAVTIAYERNRLVREGWLQAVVFDQTSPGPQPDALVFDVSSPEKIATARGVSERLDRAMNDLREWGHIDGEYPGFDVLTLDPRLPDRAARLIEVKSSGTDDRVQEITWNEWKTARGPGREHFYLYRIGNLRSDLPGRVPFVRVIRDPFGQLAAWVEEHRVTERKVYLAADSFRSAERLDLVVRSSDGE